MTIKDLAKWFLIKNPVLRDGYIDENTKLNKLLYFSHLMYYAITNQNLTNCVFEKWDNGPVSREIYRAYRYEGLGCHYDDAADIISQHILKILQIVNFVYANKTARELSEETHTHSIWQEVGRNEKIIFENIAPKERNFMKCLYETYKDMDFERISMEKIGDNIYYYDKDNLDMSDEVVEQLEKVDLQKEPIFVESIEGELVFS